MISLKTHLSLILWLFFSMSLSADSSFNNSIYPETPYGDFKYQFDKKYQDYSVDISQLRFECEKEKLQLNEESSDIVDLRQKLETFSASLYSNNCSGSENEKRCFNEKIRAVQSGKLNREQESFLSKLKKVKASANSSYCTDVIRDSDRDMKILPREDQTSTQKPNSREF